MWKLRSLLPFLAAALVFATLAFILTKPREPTYRDRSLSYWLEAPESVDTSLAVRAIGTNAIPFLLVWISYETPAWKKALASFALKHHLHLAFDARHPREPEKAMTAFSILRTNALPALPAIANLTKDTDHPEAAARAALALCFFGPQALPYLADALSNTNNTIGRNLIASAIWAQSRDGAPANECVPPLLKATTDPDPKVRNMAQRAIQDIAPALLTNTPAQ